MRKYVVVPAFKFDTFITCTSDKRGITNFLGSEEQYLHLTPSTLSKAEEWVKSMQQQGKTFKCRCGRPICNDRHPASIIDWYYTVGKYLKNVHLLKSKYDDSISNNLS